MAIEQDRFDFGEKGIIAIDVRPPRLHHADIGFGEVVDGAHQKIFRHYEIGIEDGDEFPFC